MLISQFWKGYSGSCNAPSEDLDTRALTIDADSAVSRAGVNEALAGGVCG